MIDGVEIQCRYCGKGSGWGTNDPKDTGCIHCGWPRNVKPKFDARSLWARVSRLETIVEMMDEIRLNQLQRRAEFRSRLLKMFWWGTVGTALGVIAALMLCYGVY